MPWTEANEASIPVGLPIPLAAQASRYASQLGAAFGHWLSPMTPWDARLHPAHTLPFSTGTVEGNNEDLEITKICMLLSVGKCCALALSSTLLLV